MATDGVSSATGRSSRASAPSKGDNAVQQVLPVSDDGSARGRSSRSAANRRHLINIDGRTFDRNAPRGTYLDILV